MTAQIYLKDLIQKAATVVGNEANLARMLHVPQQHVTNWKSGNRTCTPEDRARLASFAKEDALQEFVRATLEKHAGTVKGEQLRQVLGKWSHQIGGASVGVLLSTGSAAFLMQKFEILSRYALDVLRCILC